MSGVCFASLDRFAGCVTSCLNAAAVLGAAWAEIPLDGEAPSAVFEADLLILSSWHERYEAILERRRGPIVPRWHSPLLQTELCQEAAKVARIVALLDQGAIPAVAVSDPAFRDALARDRVVFIPEVLATEDEYRGVQAAAVTGVNVSLFGAGHWRKNIVVQAAAFDRVRREARASGWTLHLNGQTAEDGGCQAWLRAARIPFVDHGRLDRADYLSLVAAMDVGLCATLSESYCYVAADHIALGVPTVVSPTVACLGDALRRARPDDVGEVAGALASALADPAGLVRQQRRSLDDRARMNAAAASSALSELSSLGRMWSRGGK